MKINELFTDDDAVSPVIGVILMVAITVILAAVIATFVLGLGSQVSKTAPRASFTFDYTDNSGNVDGLNITHDGGDTITAQRLKIVSDVEFQSPTDEDGGTSPAVDSATSAKWSDFADQSGTDSEISAGTQLNIESDQSDPDFSAAKIDIIWESQSGESSATLATFEGPDA